MEMTAEANGWVWVHWNLGHRRPICKYINRSKSCGKINECPSAKKIY